MWVARLEWDPGNSAEVSAARAAFQSYGARGYLAFRPGVEEAMQTFDGTIGGVEFHTRRSRYNMMMENDDDD